MTAKFLGLKTRTALGMGIAMAVAPWAASALESYFDPEGKQDGKFTFILPGSLPDINVDLNDPKHKLILDGLSLVAGSLVFAVVPKMLKLLAVRIPVIVAGWAATKIGSAFLNRSVAGSAIDADIRRELDRMATQPSSRRVSGSQGGALDAGGRVAKGQIPRGFNPYTMAPEGHVQARNGRFYRIDSTQGKVIDSAARRKGIRGPGVNTSTGRTNRVNLARAILGGLSKAAAPVGMMYEVVLALNDEEKKELGSSFEGSLTTGIAEGMLSLVDLFVNTGIWSVDKVINLVTGKMPTDWKKQNLIGDGSFGQSNLGGTLRNWVLDFNRRQLVRSKEAYFDPLRGPGHIDSQKYIRALEHNKMRAQEEENLNIISRWGGNKQQTDMINQIIRYFSGVEGGRAMASEVIGSVNTGDTNINNLSSHPLIVGNTPNNWDDYSFWQDSRYSY